MAVLATICCNVDRMAELCASWFKVDLLHRMTADTTLLEAKCRLAVMACTAGRAFFHVRHTETLTCLARHEDTAMTLRTLEQTPVVLVAESNGTGFINLEGYCYG